MSDLNGTIAVIGMSGRFPGAKDVATFWQNLLDGKDTITRFTGEEMMAGPSAGDADFVGGSWRA